MKKILLILLVGMLMAACRSSRSLEKSKRPSENITEQTEVVPSHKHDNVAEWVQRVAKNNRITTKFITASVKVSLEGMGKNISANGSLRMKRDEVIRLSIRVFGMEVGLMEFTPGGVLLIDRINRQYVRTTYSEVSFLGQAGLDFYSLQALFWNEMFVPGQQGLKAHTDSRQFAMIATSPQVVLEPRNTPKLKYLFCISKALSCVTKLDVHGQKVTDRGRFCWSYGDFQDFAGRKFPTSMHMQVTGTKKDIGLGLRLSSLKTNGGWEVHTTPSSRYKQRSVDEVLKGLNL